MPRQSIHNTSQSAWEWANEYIFRNEARLQNRGEGRDGNISIIYDRILVIKKPWVDPNFNFARMFNYRIQKWNSLVSNYVDKERLKEIKEELAKRKGSGNRLYNVTMHFKNNHKNGKDCLISVTFSKRKQTDKPVLVFHARTIEATKRMLMDLLLVQRIGEYIYGKGEFTMVCYLPSIQLNAEAFTMYHNHRDLRTITRPGSNPPYQPFQTRVLKTLDKFLTVDPMSIGYKSHRRAAKQLQRDKDGIPYSGDHHLLAKDLKLKI